MKKIISLVLAAILMLAALAGCSKDTAGGTVSTDGSTSMEKVIGTLGEAFTEKEGINVTYNPTGSGSGIQAVSEGRCDIGLSSRALKDEEKAGGLKETVLAYDGIAIIVNPENPVNDLTLDQIAKAGASLVDAGKMEQLLALLAKYGVQAVTQLQPDQYGVVATELRTLGAQL